MENELRILTGAHAGARIQLAHGEYRLGANADCDIVVSDWNGNEIVIGLTEHAIFHRAPESKDDVRVMPLQPSTIGGVVWVIGPIAALWPSDLSLIESALAAVVRADKNALVAKIRPFFFGSIVLAIAFILVFAAVSIPGRASVPKDISLERDCRQERELIGRLSLPDISLGECGKSLSITGIVESIDEKRQVGAALARFPHVPVAQNIGIVSDVLENIKGLAHQSGLSVRYVGRRRFVVAAAESDTDNVRQIIAGIQRDMQPMGVELQLDLTRRTARSVAGNLSSAIATSDVTYVETRDGTKDFTQMEH